MTPLASYLIVAALLFSIGLEFSLDELPSSCIAAGQSLSQGCAGPCSIRSGKSARAAGFA